MDQVSVLDSFYTASAPTSSGSVWDSFPSITEAFDKLTGAALTRAAYEFNKPLYNMSEQQRSPDGLLGKVGTVGMSSDTKSFLVLVLLAAGIIYLVPMLTD